MLRERYPVDKLFEEIAVHFPKVDSILAKVDVYLEDEQLYQLIKADLSQRRPKTLETGRNSTPVEVALRMLVVKRLYQYSYAENLHRQISRLTDAIVERGHSTALLDKLIILETQEYELNNELAQIDILLQAKPELFDPHRIKLLAERFEATMATGIPEEQRKVLAGWISKLLVERQGKSIIVSMELYVPPIPGPDPPTRKQYVVQHPGTPRGHLLVALQFVIPIIRKKCTRR